MKQVVLLLTLSLISIFSIAQVQIDSVIVTDETCPGDCDGTLTVYTTGGTAPEMYDIGGAPQASNIFTGLCPSTYTVTVNDALPSSDVTTATVSAPTPLTFTLSTFNCSAFGLCDGQATVTINGGTPPYLITYGSSPVQSGTQTSYINLCAGNYTVSVTDANSCPGTGPGGPGVTPFTITQPPPPPPISGWWDSMPTSCSAVCNGYATAMASGGVPPLTFSSPGSGLVCDGQPVPSVTVTDAIGQTFIIPGFTMGAHPLPSAWGNLPVTNESCPGLCDGTLDASNVTGFDPPFQYSIDGITFQSGTLFTGLCPGNYTLYISNAVPGCVGQDPFTIAAAIPLAASVNTITNASCPGSCDGDATLNVTGGQPPYTYLWNPSGCTSPNLGTCGACAGNYSCIVTDSKGCSIVINNIIITQPPGTPIITTWSTTPESCAGACDGTATVIAAGGVPPYTYIWNDPCLSTTATSLCAGCPGVYECVVTDFNGCSTTVTGITVTGPPPIIISAVTINPSCPGSCDGSIAANVSGGTPPYTYIWNTGNPADTNQTITGLCAGIYIVSITDAMGCTALDTVLLVDPPPIIILSTVITHPSCNGFCDGSAIVTVTGGTSPYVYSWSPATPTCAGTYTLTTMDAMGCILVTPVTLIDPPPVIATAAFVSNPSAIGACDGAATGTATGGTPGYVFQWMGCAPTVFTSPVSGTANINTLCDGDYQLVATDNNGCVGVSSCITIVDPPTSIAKNTNNMVNMIYPNPTGGIVNLKFSEEVKFPIEVVVIDASGKIVRKKAFNSKNDGKMDISTLPKGVYVLNNEKIGLSATIVLE